MSDFLLAALFLVTGILWGVASITINPISSILGISGTMTFLTAFVALVWKALD